MNIGKFVSAFILSNGVEEIPSRGKILSVTDYSPKSPSVPWVELDQDFSLVELGVDPSYEVISTLTNLSGCGIKRVQIQQVQFGDITRISIYPDAETLNEKLYVEYMTEHLRERAWNLYPEFDSLVVEVHEHNLPMDEPEDVYLPAVNYSAFRRYARALGFEVVLASRVMVDEEYSGYVFRVALNVK